MSESNELWNVDQVADYLNIKRSSVSRQMRRWNIQPTGREPGKAGQNLYPAAPIQTEQARRPGRGNWNPPRENLKQNRSGV